jgi:uncharacterized protein
MQIISFFAISLIVLTLTLVYLWFSFNTFFNISAPKSKLIILLVLFLLTWSFPISMLISRINENVLSRGYYIVSGAWIGLLIYLLIATIPVWLIILITKFTKTKIDIKITAIFFFIVAILFTAYGLWNAQNARIKTVEIPIKNLPTEWENKKIIQLSDLHLGMVYGKGFLEKIIQKVNAENPYVVFITGDLFDGMDGTAGTLVGTLNKFQAEKGVYFVTGNHETYFGLDKTLNILKQTNIRVLDDEVIDLNGLQIIGISYPQFGTSKNIKGIIRPGENFFPDKPSVLLYHAPTGIEFNGASSHAAAYWDPDMNFTYAKNLGIDLQLSGHAHTGQFFPFNLISHFIYDGYDYGLHTDGDFSIYTTNGVGTWGPPLRTCNNPEIVEIGLVRKN